MSKLERNWQYAEQYPGETEAQMRARRLSLELGIEPVSRSTAAHLSGVAALSRARAICEIGTGVGVSGLSLLRYDNEATLTSIEIEPEHLREARTVFADAGIQSSRLRLIEGDALHVMPRLNLAAYDLVVLDANPTELLDYFEHALTIVRPGGCVVVPGAFSHGRVPDPAARDEATQALRDLLALVADSPAIASMLSPAGDGVLTLVRQAG
ncbi:methyltransferase domain-containing protein [Leucobacter insecticola]|uniref:Methyltransferase domain-containing protein n=1 Tax=Leucobacter insecticola TaxID=2714934 RepID=A0A6G8FKI3_9MICO|nr:class I SAM-dependent methyltransferase [Leucobacter insecticola]QIM16858.1 methyltransferase domain-containing protein [Leucobacter insecticola]